MDEDLAAWHRLMLALSEAIEAVMGCKRDFEAIVVRGYLARGAPYGISPEGMLRWFNERDEELELIL